ncbi:MAG: nucleotidyltransferase domain-containing protein [Lachnospiraceae bacterium]|nr:nucleotidyltransferase domain-containing protein [Lachnospiraceae bacterium]
MFTDEMKQDLLSGLISLVGECLDAVVLYGSVARQEETSESDIDIAIILTDHMQEETKKAFLSWASELDLKYDRIFSIIDIDKKTLDTWGEIVPFYRNLQKDGVVLWKAA